MLISSTKPLIHAARLADGARQRASPFEVVQAVGKVGESLHHD